MLCLILLSDFSIALTCRDISKISCHSWADVCAEAQPSLALNQQESPITALTAWQVRNPYTNPQPNTYKVCPHQDLCLNMHKI